MKFDVYSKHLFFLTFVALFWLINYQPLSILFLFFGWSNAIAWSLLIALSYTFFHMLGSKYKHKVAAVLYSIATTWLGGIFIAWSITVVLGIASIGIRLLGKSAIPIAACAGIIWLGACVLSLISFYFGHSLIVKDVYLRLPGLTRAVKMVQLSDLHLHGLEARNELSRTLHKVTQINPDIIVITGDLLDVPGLVDDAILSQFNQFDVPIIMVSGNHDRYLGLDKVERALTHTKIKLLRDSSWTGLGMTIQGLDDSDDAQVISKKLPRAGGHGAHVLLYHKPTQAEIAAERGYTLMLCGHTHNGQIFPFTLLVRIMYKHIKGLYKISNMHLYVNQGTGTWAVPMRLGSRDEITVFHLSPQH